MDIKDIKKGMIVRILKETVFEYTTQRHKNLVKITYREDHKFGMVIGLSKRATGTLKGNYRIDPYSDDDPLYLSVEKWHDVVVIEPLVEHQRFYIPFTALPEDIELHKDHSAMWAEPFSWGDEDATS